jgi:hypothetical protein
LNGEAAGENWDVKEVTQVKIRDLGRIKIGRLGEEGAEERRWRRETKSWNEERIIGERK